MMRSKCEVADDEISVVIQKGDLSCLVCKICNDFYKSPHIITGCFCTFCYSCLCERVKNGCSTCPSCKISFDLFASGQALPDHHLQSIVDHMQPYFTADLTCKSKHREHGC